MNMSGFISKLKQQRLCSFLIAKVSVELKADPVIKNLPDVVTCLCFPLLRRNEQQKPKSVGKKRNR